uniref:Uncharacterized protein n=1 Tax=Magallana gigas TaxID=29159 RepID=K1RUC4_MAGGI
MQTRTQQVRITRGKDKTSFREHGASPYAKMTTCGKKENKTSVTCEKHTDETESAADLYSPQQLLIVTGPGRGTGKHNTIMSSHPKMASPPSAPPPPPSNTRYMDDSCGQNCPGGFYGVNCERNCPYPNYGKRCSQICDCSELKCNNIFGCLTQLETKTPTHTSSNSKTITQDDIVEAYTTYTQSLAPKDTKLTDT